jgi:hypothetical protein
MKVVDYAGGLRFARPRANPPYGVPTKNVENNPMHSRTAQQIEWLSRVLLPGRIRERYFDGFDTSGKTAAKFDHGTALAEAQRFTVFARSPLWVRCAIEGASLRRDQAAAVVSEAQFSNNWLPIGRPVDFV